MGRISDAWSIGAIDYGACAFTVRDAPHLAQAGDLVVIAPGDVHTGGTSRRHWVIACSAWAFLAR